MLIDFINDRPYKLSSFIIQLRRNEKRLIRLSFRNDKSKIPTVRSVGIEGNIISQRRDIIIEIAMRIAWRMFFKI